MTENERVNHKITAWLVGGMLVLIVGLVLTGLNEKAPAPRGSLGLGQQVVDAGKHAALVGVTLGGRLAPEPAPVVVTVGAGTYKVGRDMQAGVWTTQGVLPNAFGECFYGVSRAPGGQLADQVSHKLGNGQMTVVLTVGQWFTTTSCQQWRWVG